jgi:hypothetical protein
MVAKRWYLHEKDTPHKRICFLTTASEGRTGWRLMDAFNGSFKIAANDPVLDRYGREAIIDIGLMAVCEQDGLPPYVGFVQNVKEDSDGTITFQVDDVATQFDKRNTPKDFAVNAPAGDIFRSAIEAVNVSNPMGISCAADVAPGDVIAQDFSDVSLRRLFDEMAKTAGMEWWLASSVAPSGVTLTAHWGYRRGNDKSGDVLLRDGFELSKASRELDADALAANYRVVGGSSGTGGAFATRPSVQSTLGSILTSAGDDVAAADPSVIAKMKRWLHVGTMRDETLVRGTVLDPATLRARALTRLDSRYIGPAVITGDIPANHAILSSFSIGDSVTFSSTRKGIVTTFRVTEIDAGDKAVVAIKGTCDGGPGLRDRLTRRLREIEDNISDLQRTGTLRAAATISPSSGGAGGPGGCWPLYDFIVDPNWADTELGEGYLLNAYSGTKMFSNILDAAVQMIIDKGVDGIATYSASGFICPGYAGDLDITLDGNPDNTPFIFCLYGAGAGLPASSYDDPENTSGTQTGDFVVRGNALVFASEITFGHLHYGKNESGASPSFNLIRCRQDEKQTPGSVGPASPGETLSAWRSVDCVFGRDFELDFDAGSWATDPGIGAVQCEDTGSFFYYGIVLGSPAGATFNGSDIFSSTTDPYPAIRSTGTILNGLICNGVTFSVAAVNYTPDVSNGIAVLCANSTGTPVIASDYQGVSLIDCTLFVWTWGNATPDAILLRNDADFDLVNCTVMGNRFLRAPDGYTLGCNYIAARGRVSHSVLWPNAPYGDVTNDVTGSDNLLDGGGSGGGHVIEDEGTPLAQRSALNFVGSAVTATDDEANDASVVTIDVSGIPEVGSLPTSDQPRVVFLTTDQHLYILQD